MIASSAGRHHPRVVEERHVEGQPIRNPPPLARQQHGVAIAEAPAAVAAQRAAAAERREQEVRDLVVVIERRLQPAAQRDHPVLAQDRNVLHELGIEPVEAVGAVAIGVVMASDLVQPAAPRVVGGRPPVDRRGDRRVQVRGTRADTRCGLGAEAGLDRGEITGRVLQRVVFVRRRPPSAATTAVAARSRLRPRRPAASETPCPHRPGCRCQARGTPPAWHPAIPHCREDRAARTQRPGDRALASINL